MRMFLIRWIKTKKAIKSERKPNPSLFTTLPSRGWIICCSSFFVNRTIPFHRSARVSSGGVRSGDGEKKGQPLVGVTIPPPPSSGDPTPSSPRSSGPEELPPSLIAPHLRAR